MSYTSLQQALDEHLKTVTGLPPLNEENTRAVPKTNVAWSRSTFLPAVPLIESLGASGKQRKQGLFQIDLYYPIGTGVADANEMADTVLSYFSSSADITSSPRIYIDRSWREPGKTLDNFYYVSVLVSWFAFATK
jgi:hypothetical protein